MNSSELLAREIYRQDNNIELIASENFVSDAIQKAVGSCLTNKYAEGYPGKRYYGGCDCVDDIETYCQQKWKEVFNTHYHVNVQPHSGSNANLAAYLAVLNPGDCVLSMSLENGGHLSHGLKANISGKLYDFHHYGVDKNGFIDYNDLELKIRYFLPKLIIAGASAYSRIIDYEKIHKIIEKVRFDQFVEFHNDYDPVFMVDMAHVAGLIAVGLHPTPFGYADIITTTTHKTLRGPRGGMIFCTDTFAKKIDSAVFPGTQGGPLMHVILGKAVCAEECLTPEYKEYIQQVVNNAATMAQQFKELGYDIVTGGTDNHMFLLDLSKKFPKMSGKQAQEELDKFYITVNKNTVPNETRSPMQASGIRIGTPAMTTKGWVDGDFIDCAINIHGILTDFNRRIENG